MVRSVPLYCSKLPQFPPEMIVAELIFTACTELNVRNMLNIKILVIINIIFLALKIFSYLLLYSGSFSTHVINVILFSSVSSKSSQSVSIIILFSKTIYVFSKSLYL